MRALRYAFLVFATLGTLGVVAGSEACAANKTFPQDHSNFNQTTPSYSQVRISTWYRQPASMSFTPKDVQVDMPYQGSVADGMYWKHTWQKELIDFHSNWDYKYKIEGLNSSGNWILLKEDTFKQP